MSPVLTGVVQAVYQVPPKSRDVLILCFRTRDLIGHPPQARKDVRGGNLSSLGEKARVSLGFDEAAEKDLGEEESSAPENKIWQSQG